MKLKTTQSVVNIPRAFLLLHTVWKHLERAYEENSYAIAELKSSSMTVLFASISLTVVLKLNRN